MAAKIVYTGAIYQGKQKPDLLFAATKQLIENGIITKDSISFEFYGHDLEWICELATRYGIADMVRYHGFVSREEARKAQREANALLVLKWDAPKCSEGRLDAWLCWITGYKEECRRILNALRNNEREDGVYTGKVFEYLPLSAPILAVGGCRDVVSDLLKETHRGIDILTLEQAKQALLGTIE